MSFCLLLYHYMIREYYLVPTFELFSPKTENDQCRFWFRCQGHKEDEIFFHVILRIILHFLDASYFCLIFKLGLRIFIHSLIACTDGLMLLAEKLA